MIGMALPRPFESNRVEGPSADRRGPYSARNATWWAPVPHFNPRRPLTRPRPISTWSFPLSEPDKRFEGAFRGCAGLKARRAIFGFQSTYDALFRIPFGHRKRNAENGTTGRCAAHCCSSCRTTRSCWVLGRLSPTDVCMPGSWERGALTMKTFRARHRRLGPAPPPPPERQSLRYLYGLQCKSGLPNSGTVFGDPTASGLKTKLKGQLALTASTPATFFPGAASRGLAGTTLSLRKE